MIIKTGYWGIYCLCSQFFCDTNNLGNDHFENEININFVSNYNMKPFWRSNNNLKGIGGNNFGNVLIVNYLNNFTDQKPLLLTETGKRKTLKNFIKNNFTSNYAHSEKE